MQHVPSKPFTKQSLSIRLDPAFYQYAKSKPNASRYIANLIKQDYAMEVRTPITEVVKKALLEDEEFFNEVVERVMRKSRNY